MIYPIIAAYAQYVLRVNYEYVDVLKNKNERLKAKTFGLVRHDRYLRANDNYEHIDAKKALSANEQKIRAIAA